MQPPGGAMNNSPAFLFAMTACCLLDIVMLFWMLNPFSARSENPRLYAEVTDTAPVIEAGKPTPLGVAAVRALLQRSR
jgi:hypothetical protein